MGLRKINETQENQEGGNNHPPSSFSCRKYIFTLNNYNEESKNQVLNFMKNFAKKWIVGEEVGAKGTPHLQGYVEFKSQKKWSVMIEQCEAFKKAWSTGAKGTLEDNFDYCSKEEKYYHGGFNPDKIKYKVHIENFYKWELDIINLLDEKTDDRKIHWFWEPKGCAGKTTFQKYIYTHYDNVVVLSGKASDMKNGVITFIKENGETPDIVLINIPRSVQDYVSFEGIESIKDMFFFSGKYEGGMVCGAPPKVLIFGNAPPKGNEMSADRWVIKKI